MSAIIMIMLIIMISNNNNNNISKTFFLCAKYCSKKCIFNLLAFCFNFLSSRTHLPIFYSLKEIYVSIYIITFHEQCFIYTSHDRNAHKKYEFTLPTSTWNTSLKEILSSINQLYIIINITRSLSEKYHCKYKLVLSI